MTRTRRRSAPAADSRIRPGRTIGLPLGLQYIYASLACRRFAEAMATHPAASGGCLVDLWTRDPRRLEPHETETFIHTAPLLPDGMLLDAEGRRDFKSLCGDFGIDPALSELRDGGPARREDDAHAVRPRRLADVCLWDRDAPLASEIETASDAFEKARADFEARGGLCGDPVEMLDRAIAEFESGTPKRGRRSGGRAKAGGFDRRSTNPPRHLP